MTASYYVDRGGRLTIIASRAMPPRPSGRTTNGFTSTLSIASAWAAAKRERAAAAAASASMSHRGRAAHAFEHPRHRESGDHPLRLRVVDRSLAERDVVDHLRQHPARAHHHHRPEHRVAPHAQDALDPADHRRDEGATNPGVRIVGPRARDERVVLGRGIVHRDAESDAARLGLVLDVGREDLHRHRPTDRRGGPGCLRGAACDPRLHHRDAPRGEKPQRLVLVQPAAVVAVPGRTTSGRIRTCPRTGRESFPDPRERRHRAHRPHRILEHRHVQRLVRGDRLVGGRPSTRGSTGADDVRARGRSLPPEASP